MAAGAITATRIRATAVDFSYPYFFTRIGYYTRKPSPLPKTFAIFWPFQKSVWLSLAVTIPAFCFLYWAFSKVHKRGFAQKFTLSSAVLQTGQIIIMKGMIQNK